MSESESIPSPAEPVNHRLDRRREVQRKVEVIVRRGTMGLGPNLALRITDATQDGLGLRLSASVQPNTEVAVELSVPGVGKPVKIQADVRWCLAVGDGTFLAGIRLRRRLSYTEVSSLTQ
ncbi:MAG TPA: PilZ domain-containing protein [Gemmataceae bacterium]|jgi:hypothetical protein|nr:PilZ domain-containing protein [Gemmataceae bacterium]